MKAFAWCAGIVLLLTTMPASAEWRTPTIVAVGLETEIRGGERQAILLLSAVAGTSGCVRASDLKTTANFDETSAVIEILGYDYTPPPPRTDLVCPAVVPETHARVPLSNSWLKPNRTNWIVFVLGSNNNSYVMQRNGFRVELLPENPTTVLTRRPGYGPTVPPPSLATILWPADFGCLYLAGSVVADQDYRVALRTFAKAYQMEPADEVHESLHTDTPARLCVRVLPGTLPPPNTGHRIGALPGHPEVEVYLGAPLEHIDVSNKAWRVALHGVWISALAVDPQNPMTVYAARGQLTPDRWIYKSTDGGTSWMASALPGPALGNISALAVASSSSSIVYAAGWGGIYKSSDGGGSWVDTHLPAGRVSALAIDPQKPDIVYAGTSASLPGLTESRVFKSVDGGLTWITPNAAFQTIDPGSGMSVCSWTTSGLAVDPQNSNIVYATTSDCNDQGGLLYKSTDGGTSWNNTRRSVTGLGNPLAVDPQNPGTVYAAFQGKGIAKSTDWGESWTMVVPDQPETFFVTNLVIDPQTPSTMYAVAWTGLSGPWRTVYKSIDGGLRWTPFDEGLTDWNISTIAVGSAGPNAVYVGGTDTGVFRIMDDIPVVSLDSSHYCIGSFWTLKVNNGATNASINLLGTSTDHHWQVEDWHKTDGNGNWSEGGSFAAGTEGSHFLRVDIGGALSNIVSFVVSDCRP